MLIEFPEVQRQVIWGFVSQDKKAILNGTSNAGGSGGLLVFQRSGVIAFADKTHYGPELRRAGWMPEDRETGCCHGLRQWQQRTGGCSRCVLET